MSDDVAIETLKNQEMYVFDMIDGEKEIGQINISIHRAKRVPYYKGKHIYPDSWFVENSDKLKQVLEIDGFATIGNSGAGYGRAGLQRAYEMSLEKGCEGRVEVHATWGAGSFYEHCGFIGKEKGQPGIKCFEPTPENIEKLYKGGRRENLTFQTAKPVDFGDWNIEELLLSEDDGAEDSKILPNQNIASKQTDDMKQAVLLNKLFEGR